MKLRPIDQAVHYIAGMQTDGYVTTWSTACGKDASAHRTSHDRNEITCRTCRRWIANHFIVVIDELATERMRRRFAKKGIPGT